MNRLFSENKEFEESLALPQKDLALIGEISLAAAMLDSDIKDLVCDLTDKGDDGKSKSLENLKNFKGKLSDQHPLKSQFNDIHERVSNINKIRNRCLHSVVTIDDNNETVYKYKDSVYTSDELRSDVESVNRSVWQLLSDIRLLRVRWAMVGEDAVGGWFKSFGENFVIVRERSEGV